MDGENECQCVLEYLTDGDRFGEWAFPVIAKNVATIRGKRFDRNVFFLLFQLWIHVVYSFCVIVFSFLVNFCHVCPPLEVMGESLGEPRT